MNFFKTAFVTTLGGVCAAALFTAFANHDSVETIVLFGCMALVSVVAIHKTIN